MPHITWWLEAILACSVVFVLLWGLFSATTYWLLSSEFWRIWRRWGK